MVGMAWAWITASWWHIPIVVLAYLLVGYSLGKMLNHWYYDNTPTEQLGFWRRCVRRIAFPTAYEKWGYIRCVPNERCDYAHGIIRCACDAGDLYTIEENREKYCRVLSILWPLLGGSVLLGIVSTVFVETWNALGLFFDSVTKLGGAMSSAWNRVGRAFTAWRARKSGSAEISDIDFEAGIAELTSAKTALASDIAELEKHLREANALYQGVQGETSEDGLALRNSYARLIETIGTILNTKKECAAQFEQALAGLSEKRKGLEGQLAVLRIYEALGRMADTEAERRTAQEMIRKTRAAYDELLNRARSAETKALLSPRIPVPLAHLEAQLRESAPGRVAQEKQEKIAVMH